MMGRMALGQKFLRELLSPLASYGFNVLPILSSVTEDWTTGLLEVAVPEIRSLSPT